MRHDSAITVVVVGKGVGEGGSASLPAHIEIADNPYLEVSNELHVKNSCHHDDICSFQNCHIRVTK